MSYQSEQVGLLPRTLIFGPPIWTRTQCQCHYLKLWIFVMAVIVDSIPKWYHAVAYLWIKLFSQEVPLNLKICLNVNVRNSKLSVKSADERHQLYHVNAMQIWWFRTLSFMMLQNLRLQDKSYSRKLAPHVFKKVKLERKQAGVKFTGVVDF